MTDPKPATANIVLVGYRGTGKTTVARLLGERLEREWIDADAEVEALAGKSIKAIFDDDGEAAFRDFEEQVAARWMERENLILATGGGVVLRESNRRQLARGLVVWLTAPAETLFERIYADPTTSARRPDLTDQGGLDEIRSVLALRTPWYRELADFEVDTQSDSPNQVASRIVSLLESARGDANE